MKPEFEVKEKVTFKPYELALAAEVIEVLPNHFKEGEIVYYLRSNHSKYSGGVCTYTSGTNIVESKLFKDHNCEALGTE